MANYFQLITALILLAEIQGGLSVPSPESSPLLAANTNDNQQVKLKFFFEPNHDIWLQIYIFAQ